MATDGFQGKQQDLIEKSYRLSHISYRLYYIFSFQITVQT
jgi:hypothetical protein